MRREVYEQHKKAFLKVRDYLRARGEYSVLALAFKKPLKWYGKHSLPEAVQLLKQESEI